MYDNGIEVLAHVFGYMNKTLFIINVIIQTTEYGNFGEGLELQLIRLEKTVLSRS